MFFFSGYWGIYFLFSLFPSFGSSGCCQCLLVACFLDLIYNPRVLSISAGYMFLSCAALFSSFFLFVHCFNCLLPLSAAVSGSSLRLFQCLVLFEFSLPLFALSIRSVILFSFSFVCLFRKFYSRYNDFVSIYNIPLGGMLTDFFILIVRP